MEVECPDYFCDQFILNVNTAANITPWSRDLLAKLTVAQLTHTHTYIHFMMFRLKSK